MGSYVAYDVVFGGSPDVVVRNVRSVGYNDSAQVVIDRAAGSADPGKFYLGTSEPMNSLQSTDLVTLLGLNGGTFVSSGICLNSNTLTIPVAVRADCAVLTAGATHDRMAGPASITTPTQFEVRQDSEEGAMCSFEVRWRSSDGILIPVTYTPAGYTLTASSLGTTFGLGKAFIDNVEIGFLTGIVVNPGIQILTQRYGGGIFPRNHFIQYREPTIDILCENLSLASSFMHSYSSTLNAALRVFFRARKDGSVYETDVSLNHVRFSFAAGFYKIEALDAAQSGNGSATIRCYGKSLVSATGVAIA